MVNKSSKSTLVFVPFCEHLIKRAHRSCLLEHSIGSVVGTMIGVFQRQGNTKQESLNLLKEMAEGLGEMGAGPAVCQYFEGRGWVLLSTLHLCGHSHLLFQRRK